MNRSNSRVLGGDPIGDSSYLYLPKAATYKKWQEEGYQVIKGERSIGRNADGEAIFTSEQVALIEEQDWDYEDDWMFDAGTGRPW